MHHFSARRQTLAQTLISLGGGVAIVKTAPEVMRNNDAAYPYRHDSSFYYLTGFTEPEAVLVLIAIPGQPIETILFCREKNAVREIWDGFRYGPQAARTTFGVDKACPITEFGAQLPTLLRRAPQLFIMGGTSMVVSTPIDECVQQVLTERSYAGQAMAVKDVQPLLSAMRLVKDDIEIGLMERAGGIAGAAHRNAMAMTRPGLKEYQLEASFLHDFRFNGAEGPSYNTIVAAGANACVLHYRAGSTELKNGDLVLIDAGCEYESYASDITRTFPVNGRFSDAQATLYNLVLSAQEEAIKQIVPGKRFVDVHTAALRVLVEGMLDTGLLNKAIHGSVENVIESKAYTQFYMHRTSHWLGMDVHDVGSYSEEGTAAESTSKLLQPGMVLTVEPGIYVRPSKEVPTQYWNIGIRIEDDVLVVNGGSRIMSDSAPKTIKDIESVMATRK